MERVLKFQISDAGEQDWVLDDYANGKFQNLTDEHFTEVVAEITREAIAINSIYYDLDDIERATQELLPTLSSILLHPRFSHVRADYDLLVELVSYLTIRLA